MDGRGDCHNTATYRQAISIVDAQAPAPSVADLSVGCDDSLAPAGASATDNCDAPDEIALTHAAGAVEASPDGATFSFARTWTATDSALKNALDDANNDRTFLLSPHP